MDATARIKNLSIALEALSRIAQCNYFYDVEHLLRDEVATYKKENQEASPPARPAATTFDDEIPF